MEKLPISLVVITLNEENNIARCLRSVPFAQEIIVVDSFSSDQTASIASSLGAKVIQNEFLGYRAQKQFALEQATQSWVLSLDADEALSPRLQEEIIEELRAPRTDGYEIPRLSFHLGRWIRHGGWYPDYQLRLFRKEKAAWVGGKVHEYAHIIGKVDRLQGDLLHYVFKDLEDQIDTNNEFSSLGAGELVSKGKRFSSLKLLVKPLSKFFECYIWKAGFLDGSAGFIIALGAAQSVFLKYAKLWEYEMDTEREVYTASSQPVRQLGQDSG